MKNIKIFFILSLFVALFLPLVLYADFTDNDDALAGFGGGVKTDVQWDGVNTWLELDNDGLSDGSGTFTSRIFDAGVNTLWQTFSWVPQLPTYKELPDNEGVEVAYNAGNADMTDNVLLLHLNETDGATTFDDDSPVGNDGSCDSGAGDCPTASSTGLFYNAFAFDGSDDYIQLPSQPVSNLIGDQFTIAFWVHPGGTIALPSFGFTGSNGFNAHNPIASYSGGLNIGDGNTFQLLPALPGASANVWTHYAIVDDGTNYVRYVNGVQIASTAITTNPVSVPERAFRIGGSAFDFGSDSWFPGRFDEFAIWKRDFSPAEVLNLYKRGALRLKHQVRSCNDAACAGETFVGPDGTGATYFTELTTSTLGLPSKSISQVAPFNRYFQYQTTFETATTTLSPELNSVTIVEITPGVTITESLGTTDVTEGGATDSYTIVLDSEPTADVTITIFPDSESSVSTSSIVFTALNWDTPQTVTATAVNDDIDENAEVSTISHSSISFDLNYFDIDIDDVLPNITDNDTAGVTITQTAGGTTSTEAGTPDTYTLVLNSEPTADVTVSIIVDEDITVSTGTIVFTSSNWDTPVTVTTTAVNDSIAEDAHVSTITHEAVSFDMNYFEIDIDDVVANVTDNDTAGFTVSAISDNTTEAGGTATYTIVLTSQPTESVSIPVSSNNTSEGTIATSSLFFSTSSWNLPRTITVTGIDDALVDGDISFSIVHAVVTSTDLFYDGLNPSDVNVTNTDDDVADPAPLRNYNGRSTPYVSIDTTEEDTPPVSEENNDEDTIVLNNGQRKELIIGKVVHHVTRIRATERFATIVLESDPVRLTLEKNKTTQVDSDGDRKFDLSVTYLGLYNGNPKFIFTSLLPDTITPAHPTSTPSTVLDVPKFSCLLQIGSPYKLTQAPGIYLIDVAHRRDGSINTSIPCAKRPFMNAELYFSYFESWQNVRTVESKVLTEIPDDEIVSIPIGPRAKIADGSLIKRIADPTVYLVMGSELRWIATENVFRSAGYIFTDIKEISDEVFKSIPIGMPLQSLEDIPLALRRFKSTLSLPLSEKVRFERFLTIGVVGKDVRYLQRILKELGYFSAEVTGYFGSRTFEAVKQFQADRGIESLGYVGPATREALNSL